MLKAAKIVLNLSKFPDSSSKNLNQVNLLAEFKRENNPIQNENCSQACVFAVVFSYVVLVKSTVEILQNFVAFSEYMNFN